MLLECLSHPPFCHFSFFFSSFNFFHSFHPTFLFWNELAPLACLALRPFAYPFVVLSESPSKIAFMPKTCDTALADRCYAVQQTSLRSLWFPVSSRCASFRRFHGPLHSDSAFPNKFTSSLFTYFSSSHRWLLIMSSTCLFLCLRLEPIAWYPLFPWCPYVPEVIAGSQAYLMSQVVPLQSALSCSTLKSWKSLPAEPLVFPEVKNTRECPPTFSYCFIWDVRCLLAFWRSLEIFTLKAFLDIPTGTDDPISFWWHSLTTEALLLISGIK